MAKLTAFKLNAAGVADVLQSDDIARELTARMEAALAKAQADAPVDSGAYRASLRLVQTVFDNRVAVSLVAEVAYALAVEADTGTLSRALDAAGGER